MIKTILGKLLFFVFSISFCFSFGQELISSIGVPSFSTASQGDLYVDDNDVYYIGLEDGSLKEIGVVIQTGASDDEILAWNASNQQWQPQAPQLGDLSTTLETVNNTKRVRVQVSSGIFNSQESIIQSISLSNIEMNETDAILNANQLTGLAGDIRFVVQLNMNSSGQRTNFFMRLNLNGTLHARQHGHLYARNGGNGHNLTGGQFIFEVSDVESLDVFSFELEGETISASVNLVSDAVNTSYVFIEEFSPLEVVTSATAPIDNTIAQGPQGPSGSLGPEGPPGAVINTPSDVYHAAGNVQANGTPNYIEGATVTYLSTGRYRVNFNNPHANGSDYPVLFSMEQNPGDDDYVPTYDNLTANGFDVEIGEQDNGASPGTPRDAGFSFYVSL